MDPIPVPDVVRKNAPWSFSKAAVIQNCSLQFAHKYGVFRDPAYVKGPASTESRIGTAVHKALELTLSGGTVLPVAIDMATNQGVLTINEEEELKSYYEAMDHFVKRIAAFRKKHHVLPQNVILERKTGMTYDYKPTAFYDDDGFFRGAIDFLLITPSGDALIVDHKSGKQKELSSYSDQCKGYCVLALAMRPEIKNFQTGINFVKTDQLQWNPSVSAKTVREEYRPWLTQFLAESCAKLQVDAPPTPCEGWWCNYCDYRPLCPAVTKKP
jgi:hypothetical protein